jgi:hypothetical protein
MSDDLRARRLARQIAHLGVIEERYTAILAYGSARYQEGYERGKQEKEEPPTTPDNFNF